MPQQQLNKSLRHDQWALDSYKFRISKNMVESAKLIGSDIESFCKHVQADRCVKWLSSVSLRQRFPLPPYDVTPVTVSHWLLM